MRFSPGDFREYGDRPGRGRFHEDCSTGVVVPGSILHTGAAERNAIVPLLVVVHPRFIYWEMSDVLSTAIGKSRDPVLETARRR